MNFSKALNRKLGVPVRSQHRLHTLPQSQDVSRPLSLKMANGAPYGHMEKTMSPVMDNFVHSLVEMAKAMEELPQVQAELERTSKTVEHQGSMIASREESILRLKADIEALQAKVRDAEASRDDAELRFLDLDEKAGKVLRFLATVTDGAKDAGELLSPPKPEPVVPQPEPSPEPRPTPDMGYGDPSGDWQQPPQAQPEPVQMQPAPIAGKPYDYYDAQGRGQYWVRNEVGQFAPVQREPDPTPAPVASPPQTVSPTEPIASTETQPAPTISDGGSQQGQSEAGPTVSSTESQSPNALGGTAQAPIASEPTAKPSDAALPPTDDVGYHNEPANYTTEWYSWADRMDQRYGFSKWPQRIATAAQ